MVGWGKSNTIVAPNIETVRLVTDRSKGLEDSLMGPHTIDTKRSVLRPTLQRLRQHDILLATI